MPDPRGRSVQLLGRPHLSISDFARLLEAHPRALPARSVLMFGGHVRLGEVVALRRGDLDLTAGTFKIERQAVETRGGVLITRTKTERVRVVDLPSVTLEAMRDYLSTVPKAMPTAPLPIREDGQPFTRAQLRFAFEKARESTGLT